MGVESKWFAQHVAPFGVLLGPKNGCQLALERHVVGDRHLLVPRRRRPVGVVVEERAGLGNGPDRICPGDGPRTPTGMQSDNVDAEPPTVPGKDGRYPVPMPGITRLA